MSMQALMFTPRLIKKKMWKNIHENRDKIPSLFHTSLNVLIGIGTLSYILAQTTLVMIQNSCFSRYHDSLSIINVSILVKRYKFVIVMFPSIMESLRSLFAFAFTLLISCFRVEKVFMLINYITLTNTWKQSLYDISFSFCTFVIIYL